MLVLLADEFPRQGWRRRGRADFLRQSEARYGAEGMPAQCRKLAGSASGIRSLSAQEEGR